MPRVTHKKKIVKKKKPKVAAKKSPKPIGVVSHYYGKIKVAVVKFTKPTKKGARVRFRGATTDFAQELGSMQFNHAAIARAPKGKKVGIKVAKRVREGDKIYFEE